MKISISVLLSKYRDLHVIKKATIWFVIVNVLNKAVAFLTTPIVTRLMASNEIGQYSVYSTWLSIFEVVFSLSLFCGILEVNLTEHKEDENRVTASLTLLCLISITLCFATVFLFAEPVSQWINVQQELFPLMFVHILSMSIVQFWGTQKRFSYDYKKYAILISGTSITQMVMSVVLVYLNPENRVFFRILGLVAPYGIVALVLGFQIFKKSVPKGITHYWKDAIAFNIVLIPHYLSNILLSSSDKIMIAKLVNDEKAGIYAITYSYASIILLVFNAINSAFSPFAYKAIEERNYDELDQRTFENTVLSAVLAIMAMLVGPEMMRIIAPAEYQEGIVMIPILIFGIYMSFFYSIFSPIEFLHKKNVFITVATLSGSMVNIVLNWFLIPVFGYMMASVTTAIGYIMLAIAHYFMYRKLSDEPIFNMKRILLVMSLFFALTILIIIIYPLWYMRYLLLFVLFILVAVLVKKAGRLKIQSK